MWLGMTVRGRKGKKKDITRFKWKSHTVVVYLTDNVMKTIRFSTIPFCLNTFKVSEVRSMLFVWFTEVKESKKWSVLKDENFKSYTINDLMAFEPSLIHHPFIHSSFMFIWLSNQSRTIHLQALRSTSHPPSDLLLSSHSCCFTHTLSFSLSLPFLCSSHRFYSLTVSFLIFSQLPPSDGKKLWKTWRRAEFLTKKPCIQRTHTDRHTVSTSNLLSFSACRQTRSLGRPWRREREGVT